MIAKIHSADCEAIGTSEDLGPGFYPSQVKISKLEQRDNLSFGRSNRFGDASKAVPGPGHYNSHKHTTWIK